MDVNELLFGAVAAVPPVGTVLAESRYRGLTLLTTMTQTLRNRWTEVIRQIAAPTRAPRAATQAAGSRVIALAGAVLPGEQTPLGTTVRNRPRLSVPPRRLSSALGLP